MSPFQKDARQVAAFLLERLQAQSPSKWKQAARARPLLDEVFPEELEIFNSFVLFRVPQDACLGLLEWARGNYQGELCAFLPSWREILHAQARGQRPITACATLPASALDVAGIPKKYSQQDVSLAFALHDLRHLHKFFEAPLFQEQLRFFRALHSALDSPQWQHATEGAPEAFHAGLQRIASDMNGAAPFLLMALKSLLRDHFSSDSLFQRLVLVGQALNFSDTDWDFWKIKPHAANSL